MGDPERRKGLIYVVWFGLVWYVWIELGPKPNRMMSQRGKDRRLGVRSQASSWRSRGRGSAIDVAGCEERVERSEQIRQESIASYRSLGR